MKIIQTEPISTSELKELSKRMFGSLVKAVVDIEQQLMAVDADLHSDQEEYLLKNGSKQADLWGINIYPELIGPEMIEFDSMINLRPSYGNRSRGVDDAKTREKIIEIVLKLIKI